MADSTIHREVRSIAELRAVLDELPDQTMGDRSAVSQIGKPYIEFLNMGLARPGDEAVIEREVVGAMVRSLNGYLNDKSGTIYWRTRLEVDVTPWYVILYYDNNGPDINALTDRKCVKDSKWVRIALYCRLVRAESKVVEAPAAE
jgi:hypothetical protein